MNRKELEKLATELGINFTAQTPDDALETMIQLAQQIAAQATHIEKLETTNEIGSELPVLSLNKKLYRPTAKQFLFNPYKLKPSKMGAGGLFNRSLENNGMARVVATADLEKDENKEVVEWLLLHNSPILEEVTKGGK